MNLQSASNQSWWMALLLVALASTLTLGSLFTEFRRKDTSLPNQDEPEMREVVKVAANSEPILPLPESMPLNAAKVALGEKLFSEKKLSVDGNVACASCHRFDHGGADVTPLSAGVQHAPTGMNAPSIFNLPFNFKLNWEGNFDTLEQHLERLMENPVAVGEKWPQVVAKFRADPGYAAEFKQVFGEAVSKERLIEAIVEFERSLVTPNSRFDRYLRGDRAALNEKELEGYRLFRGLGCVSCHQGMNVGGNMFQKLGVMTDYFPPGVTRKPDLGRFAITGREEDRHVFRVPSLRNVALTAPYLHNGSAPTLEAAVAAMGRYQLGQALRTDEIDRIVAFLKTLTGEYRGQPLAP
jgi:cytochrome c peroxidase